jgi:hypothetical protein
MSNIRVNESPNHFIVLDGISRGVKSVDKIAKMTRLDRTLTELIVNDLAEQRLILKTEKKGFFGNKKLELTITQIGIQLLGSKKQELEQKFQQLQQWYSNGQMQQMQNSMQSDRMWLPFMLFSGIMNALFFMSMMSFMGASATPAESAFAGGESGAADTGAAGADDAGAGADAGGDFGGDMGGDFSF